eukprot:118310-Chlamydomonas_euryale.AAC.2
MAAAPVAPLRAVLSQGSHTCGGGPQPNAHGGGGVNAAPRGSASVSSAPPTPLAANGGRGVRLSNYERARLLAMLGWDLEVLSGDSRTGGVRSRPPPPQYSLLHLTGGAKAAQQQRQQQRQQRASGVGGAGASGSGGGGGGSAPCAKICCNDVVLVCRVCKVARGKGGKGGKGKGGKGERQGGRWKRG